jgi:endonuclease III
MKNAAKYQKKIRKLLSGMDKSVQPLTVDADTLKVMVEAIVGADAVGKQGEKALASLAKEFVDFNELRVAPTKEIVDALGRDYPYARQKATELVTSLNAVFNRHNVLSLDPLAKMPKRDLRRHLTELGLCPYASGYLLLFVYGAHALPVDESLVECLEIDGAVGPGSSAEDVQALLERTILQKHVVAAHAFFREYVAKSSKALTRKRKADAVARAAADPETASSRGGTGEDQGMEPPAELDQIEPDEGGLAVEAKEGAPVAPKPAPAAAGKGRKPEPRKARPPRPASRKPPHIPRIEENESVADEDEDE